jgi:type IV pilus assembly protein PilC
MSRLPDDQAADFSRRERSPSDRPTKAKRPGARSPAGEDPEGSTFRPSPVRSLPAGQKSSKPGRRGAVEPVSPNPKWWERILFGRAGSGQLAQFCRQLAAYLNAGVAYDRALGSLRSQFSGTALGPVIERVKLRIRAGSTLEEAFQPEARVFGAMFLSLLKVAEARGGVPETLRMLSDHYEARQRLIRQARSALIYPTIVLCAAGGVVALITLVLLPLFASLLTDISRKAQLPLASRALLGFSQLISSGGWWMLPLLMIGVPLAFLRWYQTEPGRAILDRLLLHVPVFGGLLRKLDTTRFARTMATLLDAGVGVGEAIELTAGVLAMSPIRQAVRGSRKRIEAGEELSVALGSTGQFGVDVLAVLETGEETGKLPESLNHLADDYEQQVALTVKNLGQLVQPLLVLILGGLVLFIILAVFLPYVQVLTSLSGP